VTAVTKCLTQTVDLPKQLGDAFVPLCNQLVSLANQIIDKMLNIMAGVAGKGRSLISFCLNNLT